MQRKNGRRIASRNYGKNAILNGNAIMKRPHVSLMSRLAQDIIFLLLGRSRKVFFSSFSRPISHEVEKNFFPLLADITRFLFYMQKRIARVFILFLGQQKTASFFYGHCTAFSLPSFRDASGREGFFYRKRDALSLFFLHEYEM